MDKNLFSKNVGHFIKHTIHGFMEFKLGGIQALKTCIGKFESKDWVTAVWMDRLSKTSLWSKAEKQFNFESHDNISILLVVHCGYE